MQLFKKGQAGDTAEVTAGSDFGSKTKLWFSNNKRSIAAVALIVLAALFMRTVFAFAVSANSGFALSGGTTASEHLRNITAMISSGQIFGIDSWMYAPDGSVNIHPPLVDMIVAGIGMIIKAVSGMSAEEAAGAALGSTSAIMGALACIPMYYLGKEIFGGKKKAGFLAALFLAFCPVVVTNTVFSNGTTVAFTLFFAICMFYFVVKGIKLIDNDHTQDLGIQSMLQVNKPALMYALKAALMLAVIAYSWNGFRTFVILFIFVMAAVMIVNRLKVRDARPAVAFFTVIVGLSVLVAAPYYCACGLWDLVFSGTLYATVIGLAVCISFALLQDKPWVYTIPAYIVGLVVVFVALNLGLHDVFNVIVNGNSVYSKDIQGIIGSSTLSFSQVATYFGFITMWGGAIVAIWMAFKLSKKANSLPFIAAFFCLIFGLVFAVKSATLAVVYAPFFAIGFAACIYWVFEHVDFSEYFKSFRGCTIKTVWRKIINPKPFIAIICVVLLIGAPNMMTAVDASISNNEKSDWNEDAQSVIQKALLGKVGYTVLTDEDYMINYTLKQYGKNSDDNGTMLTWVDYSADVVTYGHFKSVTDTKGNNAVAMAQILLGNETRGESTAAMIVYSMNVMGFEKGANWLYDNKYISAEAKERILNLNSHVDDYRAYILADQSTYGQLDSGISDDNVKYIFLKKYLTVGSGVGKSIGGYEGDKDKFTGLSSWALSKAYAGISSASNSKIDSVMVTVGMLPIQYGDGSVFSAIASIAGYKVESTYGNAPEFYTVNTQSGAYTYTTAMYNSLLYKTIGGKTTEEATQSGDSSTFEAVYGLSNFSADYSHFYVKYNSDEEATSTSDGWKVVTYNEANQMKKEKGGVINYFGYPVVIDVNDYSSTPSISGSVKYGDSANTTSNVLENIRVEVWTSNGYKVATAYTDKDGKYEVPNAIKQLRDMFGDQNITLTVKIYAGAAKTATTGGTLVTSYSVDKDEKVESPAYEITRATLKGYVDFQDKDITKKRAEATEISGSDIKFKVTLTGTNYGATVETMGSWDSNLSRITFEFDGLVLDTYSIKVTTIDGTSLGTGTYTVAQGENSGYSITGTICEEVVTVQDENSIPVVGAEVHLVNEKTGLDYNLATDSSGFTTKTNMLGKTVAKYILPGTYTVKVKDVNSKDKLVTSGTITVSSATSNNTVTVSEKAVTVTIDAHGCTADKLFVTNGSFQGYATYSNDKYTILLPESTLSDAAPFTAYAYDRTNVFYCVFKATDTGMVLVKDAAAYVHGTLKKVTDGDPEACSGTVYFKSSSNALIIAEAIKYTGSDNYEYRVYLPKSLSWNICATDSSSYVLYENGVTFSGDNTKDITMGKAYKISGKFYWGSSTYFRYVNMKVTNMDGVSEFSVLTDSTGSYSVMVPEDKKCTVTTPSLDGTPYCFDENQSKVAIHYDFDTDKKTNNFIAYKDNVKVTSGTYKDKYYAVTNSTGYKINVNGTDIENGKTVGFTTSMQHPYFTVKLNYVEKDGSYYYCSELKVLIGESVATEGCPVYTISDLGQIENYAERYTQVKVAYTGDNAPTVTITNMRTSDVLVKDKQNETEDKIKPFANLSIKSGDNEDKETTKYIVKYVSYFDKETIKDYSMYDKSKDIGLTDPYLVKVTRTVDSQSKIYYTTIEGKVADSSINADTMLKKAISVTGTTGSSYSGNVVFEIGDKLFSTTVSSGTYSISLPAETDINAEALVTNTVNETTYIYESKTVSVKYGTDISSATLNLPVSIAADTFDATEKTVTISEVSMTDITDSIREVTVQFKAKLDNPDNVTYLLSGGSAWKSIKFYSDAAHTKEITSITASNGAIKDVYCVGVFKINYMIDGKATTSATAAADSSNLTVIFSETNGTAVARGGFVNVDEGTLLEGWEYTRLPVHIGIGTNVYGEGQRTFSVKFVNPNNFPVTFNVQLPGVTTSDTVTYLVHCGNEIYKCTDDGVTIHVPGASTTEIQIEKISQSGDSDTTSTLQMKFTLESTHLDKSKLKVTEGSESDVIISDNVVTVNGKIDIGKSIDVKDHSAKGRGVFDSLGSAPTYIMVLSAIVLLAVIAMLWLGFRRGVFSRKK